MDFSFPKFPYLFLDEVKPFCEQSRLILFTAFEQRKDFFPVLRNAPILPFELCETELFSSLGLTAFHRLSKSVNLEYNFFSDYLIVTTNALALNQTTPQMLLSLGQICFSLSHPPRRQSSQPKNNRRNSLFLCLLRVRLSSRGSRSDFLVNKICSSRKNVSPPRKIHRSMSE